MTGYTKNNFSVVSSDYVSLTIYENCDEFLPLLEATTITDLSSVDEEILDTFGSKDSTLDSLKI